MRRAPHLQGLPCGSAVCACHPITAVCQDHLCGVLEQEKAGGKGVEVQG